MIFQSRNFTVFFRLQFQPNFCAVKRHQHQHAALFLLYVSCVVCVHSRHTLQTKSDGILRLLAKFYPIFSSPSSFMTRTCGCLGVCVFHTKSFNIVWYCYCYLRFTGISRVFLVMSLVITGCVLNRGLYYSTNSYFFPR